MKNRDCLPHNPADAEISEYIILRQNITRKHRKYFKNNNYLRVAWTGFQLIILNNKIELLVIDIFFRLFELLTMQSS